MYIFNHVPKCGGLSYRALLEELLGLDNVTHISINLEEEYYPNPEEFRQYRMLMGHFGVKWNELLGPGRRWLTALREPIDRVVSTYYYWRHDAALAPESPWLYIAQTMSLEEFLRCGHYLVLQGISNAQTWLLADDLRWRYHSVPERDALAVAKANLDRFEFIGLYEEFDDSIERMCRYLGFESPERAPHVNATSKRRSVRELNPAVLEMITELNQADIELYKYAREKARHPGMASAAERLAAHSLANGKRDVFQMTPVAVEEARALQVSVIAVPKKCQCGSVIEATVELFNGGLRLWNSAPPNPLFLAYHWLTEQGDVVVFDGWRSEIRPALERLATRRYRMHILAPATPGRYILRVTLVQELVHWFDEAALARAEEIRMVVEGRTAANVQGTSSSRPDMISWGVR